MDAEVPAIADINELTKQTHSEVTSEAIKQAINIVDYQAGVLRLNAMQNRKARTTATSSAAPANTAPGKDPAPPLG